MKNMPRYLTGLITLCALGACVPQDSATADATADAPARTPIVIIEQAVPVPVAIPVICMCCGTVRAINIVSQQGRASGAGAAIGAIVGGVAGNQIGGGSGQDIATAAGAIGGALLGHNIEQNRNANAYYEIVVDMESGGQQFINVQDTRGINVGVPVLVQGGNISLR
jgi:outer membrane lipoprotein SlyB